jgi:peptidoglycan/LPS O-acetylase OafA/YrhL
MEVRPEKSPGNCFDALRLALAGCVVFGHSFLLGGFGPEPLEALTKGQVHIAYDAVLGFFGLSGYLVAASWLRSASTGDFLWRRVRRIVPGFWACLLFTAFLIAPAMQLAHTGYLAGFPWSGPQGMLGFAYRNSLLRIRQWSVGDVVAGHPYDGSLDGSLWSLWPEFSCYVALAFLGYFGGLNRYRALLGATILGLAAGHAIALALGTAPLPLLPSLLVLTSGTRFYLAFAVGVGVRVWPAQLVLDRKGTVFLALILALSARYGGYALASPVLIPWLLVSLGENASLRLHRDISYGTYLYSFALQQLMVSLHGNSHGWLLYFLVTLAGSLAAGWLSWTLLERRFISPRRLAANQRT